MPSAVNANCWTVWTSISTLNFGTMRSTAITVTNYLQQLPPDRQVPMEKLRATIAENLPSGFTETMGYGMIGFVVPHELYSAGYHCDPKLPLPFINIASQKHFIALYHMGLYADTELLELSLIHISEPTRPY